MPESAIDFKMILASSIHDMKNALGLLHQQIEELIDTYHDMKPEWKTALTKMEYQASSINNDLIKVLSLYKIGSDVYPLHVQEHNVAEFLEEQILRHWPMAQHFAIQLLVKAEEDLSFYFDAGLVSGVLNDVMINAFKHAKTCIQLSATLEKGWGIIVVEDDGPGYPKALLEKDFENAGQSDFGSGSTGLGLYFASEVAKIHHHQDRVGKVVLDNDGPLHGGRFRIFIPL